jgi:hypothetical protein
VSSLAACGSDPQAGDLAGDHDASMAEHDASMDTMTDGGSDASDALDGGSDGATETEEGDAAMDEGDAALAADASEPDAAPVCTGGPTCVVSAVHECIDGERAETGACDKGCDEGACNTACDAAALAIDQSLAEDWAVVGTAPQWQSFQVAQTGILTALELRPNVYSSTGDPSTITLSIYVGEGIAGEPIAQQTYTLPSASGSPWHTFEFTLPAPLQGGQTYTWATDGSRALQYAKTDVYAGGRAKVATRDMTFRLHAAACH